METSLRSISIALILLGTFIVILSPAMFLWTVTLEKQAFRETGSGDNLVVKRDAQADVPINTSGFAIDYAKGERLALRIIASGNLSILVFGTPGSEGLIYPAIGIGLNCESGTCVIVESRRANVPETYILDVSDYTRLSFSNRPSDSDIGVSYKFLIAYKEVTITYPYRESNQYLIVALFGIIVLASGVVLRETMGIRPQKPIQTRETATATVFCTQCGAENPATYEYCGKCGSKLEMK